MADGSTLSVGPGELSPEQRTWRWRVLISTYFAYGGFYLTRKVFTIVKTSLSEQLSVSLRAIAHIWTAFLIAYMIGQFVNSVIGRRWGPRVLLLGGLGISIAINVIFGFSNSYSTFIGFMFFNGLAQAAGWPGAVGGVAGWMRKRERGTIMGLWNTNYIVGNMVVKSLGGLLLDAWGWRYAFFGCTLIAFGIWWLVYFWQRNKPQDVGLPAIVEEQDEDRVVPASSEDRINFGQYLRLFLNPIVPVMGVSYFCLKFLRYALDSWLPAFLNLQGLSKGHAAQMSMIFDLAGFPGVIFAGWLLDRVFRSNWAHTCIALGVGMILGYIAVVRLGGNPYALAIAFGFVGFMLYGPDSLICGAACIQVAGEANAVAVAGLVNGMASLGPVIQEETIGYLMRGSAQVGIRNTNLLTLAMSIAFVLMMIVVALYVRAAHRRIRAARCPPTPA